MIALYIIAILFAFIVGMVIPMITKYWTDRVTIACMITVAAALGFLAGAQYTTPKPEQVKAARLVL